jgi:Mn-dependent DtxR family transcriptional regulator
MQLQKSKLFEDMTLEATIKRDLEAGQSTADAIAQRAGKSLPAVMATLERLQREGVVITAPICEGRLHVWKLKL